MSIVGREMTTSDTRPADPVATRPGKRSALLCRDDLLYRQGVEKTPRRTSPAAGRSLQHLLYFKTKTPSSTPSSSPRGHTEMLASLDRRYRSRKADSRPLPDTGQASTKVARYGSHTHLCSELEKTGRAGEPAVARLGRSADRLDRGQFESMAAATPGARHRVHR